MFKIPDDDYFWEDLPEGGIMEKGISLMHQIDNQANVNDTKYKSSCENSSKNTTVEDTSDLTHLTEPVSLNQNCMHGYKQKQNGSTVFDYSCKTDRVIYEQNKQLDFSIDSLKVFAGISDICSDIQNEKEHSQNVIAKRKPNICTDDGKIQVKSYFPYDDEFVIDSKMEVSQSTEKYSDKTSSSTWNLQTNSLPALNKLHDTTLNRLHDTTLNRPHDTTLNKLHDTTLNRLHDTTLNKLHDTTLNKLHDTTLNILHDTTLNRLHDTTLKGLHDTTLNILHDTTLKGLHDTTLKGLHDTTLNKLHDTTLNRLHDTTKNERKFPGPAGVLSFLGGSDIATLSDDPADRDVSTEHDIAPVHNTSHTIPANTHSQQWAPHGQQWAQLVSDLGPNAHSLLSKFSMATFLYKASTKQLPNGKVPLLFVVVNTLDRQGDDAHAILSDQTGKVHASIHRDVLLDDVIDLTVGSLLVLRQTGVIRPTCRSHYLNVTSANIVMAYPPSNPKPLNRLAIHNLCDEVHQLVAHWQLHVDSIALLNSEINFTENSEHNGTRPEESFPLRGRYHSVNFDKSARNTSTEGVVTDSVFLPIKNSFEVEKRNENDFISDFEYYNQMDDTQSNNAHLYTSNKNTKPNFHCKDVIDKFSYTHKSTPVSDNFTHKQPLNICHNENSNKMKIIEFHNFTKSVYSLDNCIRGNAKRNVVKPLVTQTDNSEHLPDPPVKRRCSNVELENVMYKHPKNVTSNLKNKHFEKNFKQGNLLKNNSTQNTSTFGVTNSNEMQQTRVNMHRENSADSNTSLSSVTNSVFHSQQSIYDAQSMSKWIFKSKTSPSSESSENLAKFPQFRDSFHENIKNTSPRQLRVSSMMQNFTNESVNVLQLKHQNVSQVNKLDHLYEDLWHDDFPDHV